MDTHAQDGELRPAGEGDWLRRVRAFDWSATPLGPLSAWPQSLRSALQVHESEIDHLRRLQALSTRLVRDDEDEEALLQDVMAAAMAITNADSGELRLVNPDGTLELIASQGFEAGFDEFHDAVTGNRAADESARTARRILADDVAASPLLARDGRVLGVISTRHRDGVPASSFRKASSDCSMQRGSVIEVRCLPTRSSGAYPSMRDQHGLA